MRAVNQALSLRDLFFHCELNLVDGRRGKSFQLTMYLRGITVKCSHAAYSSDHSAFLIILREVKVAVKSQQVKDQGAED